MDRRDRSLPDTGGVGGGDLEIYAPSSIEETDAIVVDRRGVRGPGQATDAHGDTIDELAAGVNQVLNLNTSHVELELIESDGGGQFRFRSIYRQRDEAPRGAASRVFRDGIPDLDGARQLVVDYCESFLNHGDEVIFGSQDAAARRSADELHQRRTARDAARPGRGDGGWSLGSEDDVVDSTLDALIDAVGHAITGKIEDDGDDSTAVEINLERAASRLSSTEARLSRARSELMTLRNKWKEEDDISRKKLMSIQMKLEMEQRRANEAAVGIVHRQTAVALEAAGRAVRESGARLEAEHEMVGRRRNDQHKRRQ